MSDRWHQDRELDSLPKSELNPLINPLLERHLGRWAEVYFTSPPEQRERAVGELLQQLETEAHEGALTPGQALAPEASITAMAQAQIVCLQCQHQNVADQRFCGNCGSTLPGNMMSVAAAEPSTTTIHAVSEIASLEPVDDSRVDNPEDSDLGWLRGKAFSQWDEVEAPARRGNKVLWAGIGLMVLLAAFGGLYWASRDRTAPSPPGTALISPAATPQTTGPSADSSANAPTQQLPAEAPSHQERQSVSPAPLPAAVDARHFPGAEDGAQELLLAKQNLEGQTSTRDSSAAARLLWKAVGKHNTQAALLLSDLYVRGDGVPRNCDQARLLLVAAARKGGSAAAQQLRSFESGGCQ